MAPVKVGKHMPAKIRTGLNSRNVKSGRWLLAICFWQLLLRNQKSSFKTLELFNCNSERHAHVSLLTFKASRKQPIASSEY